MTHHLSHYKNSGPPGSIYRSSDTHYTHCWLSAYNFCKERGIIRLTIPPHTSHRVHPLVVTFHGSLRTIQNVMSVTGIFPINSDVLNAEDFAPSETIQTTNFNEPIPENHQIEDQITGERAEDIRQQSFKADPNKNEIRQTISFGERCSVAIVDETWINHNTPETKEQSKQWISLGERSPKKAKMSLSANKVMATVFWDARGVIHIEVSSFQT
ncbi:hypothetical protein HUJ05_006768 [Dendroctonus ponderosae]|nr:hypothetical protein HUJ05_006768 [Dendroctonus ponderosae]